MGRGDLLVGGEGKRWWHVRVTYWQYPPSLQEKVLTPLSITRLADRAVPWSMPTYNPLFLMRFGQPLRPCGTLIPLSIRLTFHICDLYFPKCFWKPHLTVGMMSLRSNEPPLPGSPQSSWCWGQALYDLFNTVMSVLTHHPRMLKLFWKLTLSSTPWAGVFAKLLLYLPICSAFLHQGPRSHFTRSQLISLLHSYPVTTYISQHPAWPGPLQSSIWSCNSPA